MSKHLRGIQIGDNDATSSSSPCGTVYSNPTFFLLDSEETKRLQVRLTTFFTESQMNLTPFFDQCIALTQRALIGGDRRIALGKAGVALGDTVALLAHHLAQHVDVSNRFKCTSIHAP
ncbi:MAG: hypothetical protein ABI114_08895, partial [Rhodanobacter sp.]